MAITQLYRWDFARNFWENDKLYLFTFVFHCTICIQTEYLTTSHLELNRENLKEKLRILCQQTYMLS